MPIAPTDPLIPQLAEAIGLDPMRCRSIDLHLRANDVITVTAQEYVDTEQAGRVIQAMRSAKYELVPAGAGLRGDAESARLLEAANDEIDRLRSAIRRLAEQDATLSVCDGAVTVTMDAALTDAEREAVWFAIAYAQDAGHECEAALRGLLERTK